MAGLYVKLDAEYAADDKLIEAGPMAELLYIRGLCFCKRTLSDGKIKKSQLASVALGIPSAAKHAQALVTVGAWRATQGGWVIVAWLKRNKSAAQIAEDIEARRLKSLHGNHQRWHVQEGKYDPTCELCKPGVEPPPDDPPGDPQLSLGESTETETEEEPEEKSEAETQPKEKPRKSSSVLTVVPPTDADDDDEDFEYVVGQIVAARELEYQPRKPKPWRLATRRNTIAEDGDLIERELAAGKDRDDVALHVLGHGPQAEKERATSAVPWCTTECPTCDGDAFIDTPEGLAPCPNRS